VYGEKKKEGHGKDRNPVMEKLVIRRDSRAERLFG
jgi:hypothetical protein